MSNLFDFRTVKKYQQKRTACNLAPSLANQYSLSLYHQEFFKPFQKDPGSLNGLVGSMLLDAKFSAKSIPVHILMNIRDSLGSMLSVISETLYSVIDLAFGILTLNSDEIKSSGIHLYSAISCLITACYYALSIVTDLVTDSTYFLTRSIATISLGLYEAGKSISSTAGDAMEKMTPMVTQAANSIGSTADSAMKKVMPMVSQAANNINTSLSEALETVKSYCPGR